MEDKGGAGATRGLEGRKETQRRQGEIKSDGEKQKKKDSVPTGRQHYLQYISCYGDKQ